ncbi:MAG: Asp-tRNA(Asn)/Glu-tRNA(Gln) amidotransferase subunit GatB [Nitriliruptorales bacterium]|nr:Asp-tRNA(Asn)/Glu-tRNA(Gln) amidotransferase subunit GatB [Nitriliruptorales bacterium]
MTTTTVEQATRYEAVIGLEVHVELSTRTKMFCGCATDFGGDPNTRTCEVCLGHPGSLPVVNAGAVESAIRLGLALDCEISPSSQFHRKNYFYPDMPKNYQISQYDVPICLRGHLDVPLDEGARRIGITRVHMEEDTGKSLHVGTSGRIRGAEYSLVDYNRAGIPLLECVSEPDLRTSEEARAYLAELRAIVLALAISDAKLEEGSMRCDANVSLRPVGHTVFGTRVEIKNMNSLRSLGRAIDHEIARQTDLLRSGHEVMQETRHWDEDRQVTSTLRTKEAVDDYRYFPDPDLLPVRPDPGWIDRLRDGLPELPAALRARLAERYGLAPPQVATLNRNGLVGLFEAAVKAGGGPVDVANWLTNEVTGWATAQGIDPSTVPLPAAHLAQLIGLVGDGTLSSKLARQVLDEVLESGGASMPKQIVEARGLAQMSDAGELERIVDQVITEQDEAAQRVRDGNAKAIGALVGAVMRATQGKANPQMVNQLLRERLTVS